MKRCIDRFAIWFAAFFGTEASFACWTVLLVLWLVPIFLLGFGRWNSTVGLAGNTIESTFELFLAIAVLIRANQIEARQVRQMEHIEKMVEHLERAAK